MSTYDEFEKALARKGFSPSCRGDEPWEAMCEIIDMLLDRIVDLEEKEDQTDDD